MLSWGRRSERRMRLVKEDVLHLFNVGEERGARHENAIRIKIHVQNDSSVGFFMAATWFSTGNAARTAARFGTWVATRAAAWFGTRVLAWGRIRVAAWFGTWIVA